VCVIYANNAWLNTIDLVAVFRSDGCRGFDDLDGFFVPPKMRTPFDICVALNHPKTVFSRLGGLSEFSAITLFVSLGARLSLF
jgi:hypothetical protein